MFKELKFPLDVSQTLPKRLLEEGNSDYVFGCKADNWNFPDSCKIYKVAANRKIELLYDSPKVNPNTIKYEMQNGLFSENMGKTLFLSAHFIPNLFDRYYIGDEPLKTTQISLSLMQLLKEEKGIDVDFGVLIDDLYMMFDYVNLGTEWNKYRKLFFENFVLPTKLAEILNSYHNQFDFNVIYGTEKTFADVFHRNIQTIKHTDARFVTGSHYKGFSDTSLFYKPDNNVPIKIEDDRKPNCVCAIAATLKNIAYKLDNRVQTKMYDSVIAVFPSCSMHNVIDGTKVALDFYNLDLNISLVFTTNKCF